MTARECACPDCAGTGTCQYDDGPDVCESCNGTGEYEPTPPTAAEVRERAVFYERCAEEPMYEVSVMFMVNQRIASWGPIGKAA
jgi:DnaJ-class molecular chaperone